MEGLVEIKQWLHVWTEAERARRLGIKSPCTGSPDNGEGNPANRGEETGERDSITRLPRTRQVSARDE